MKKLTFFLCLFVVNISFGQKEIDSKLLTLKEDKYYYQEQEFDGVMIVKFDNQQVKQKIDVKQGIQNGKCVQYYLDPTFNAKEIFNQVRYDSLKKIQKLHGDTLTKIAFDSVYLKSKLEKFILDEIGGQVNLENLKNEKKINGTLKGKSKKQWSQYEKILDEIRLNSTAFKNRYAILRSISQKIFLEEKIRDKKYFIEFEYDQVRMVKTGAFKSFLNSSDQNIITGSYIQGLKDGRWIENYPNGGMKYAGNYRNDCKIGMWTFYHQSSKIEAKGEFKTNIDNTGKSIEVRIGTWNYYSPFEILQRQENWDTSGKLISTVNYNYYQNTYEKNKLKEQVTVASNGDKTGRYVSFYENGNKKSEGEYLKSLQQGIWTYYFDNGKIMAKGEFIGGDGSNLGTTGIPKHNRNGDWITYKIDGKIDITSLWKSGVIINQSSYYESGKIKEKIVFADGKIKDGSYLNLSGVNYYENGSKEKEYNLIDGKLNGIVSIYYDNGMIMSSISYSNGVQNGLEKNYSIQGKIEKEFTYVNSERNGPFKIYENGVISMSGNVSPYAVDEKHLYGDLISYKNGKIESHYFIDNTGTWYDKLNPNNAPSNPKDDYTAKFKSILPSSFTSTQNGDSFLIRFDKNGTGMMMMGQYGPDNILWSVKNGDELSIYNTAFKSYLPGFKLVYGSGNSDIPVIEEHTKGTVQYWYKKN